VATSRAQLGTVGLPTGRRVAPDTYAVAVRLLRQLDADYDRLCGGDLATLEADWRAGLALEGQAVVAECADGLHSGWLRALSLDRVELGRRGAAPLLLRPEAVLHIDPAAPP
jgi:hypothetical protein